MPREVLGPGSVGFFGKLPSTGDFVARGLPRRLRPYLDNWLTKGLARHSQTPEIWPKGGLRALLEWQGRVLILLVLPSADSRGRTFPFAMCRVAGARPDKDSADTWCASVLELAQEAVLAPKAPDAVFEALTQVPETTLAQDGEARGAVLWHPLADPHPVPNGDIEPALRALFPPVSSG